MVAELHRQTLNRIFGPQRLRSAHVAANDRAGLAWTRRRFTRG